MNQESRNTKSSVRIEPERNSETNRLDVSPIRSSMIMSPKTMMSPTAMNVGTTHAGAYLSRHSALSPKNLISPKGSRPPQSAYLEAIFREIDKGMALQVMHTRRVLNQALDQLDARISSAEQNISNMYKTIVRNCDQELNLAEVLVKKELRSKILMSQWTSAFLSDTSFQQLDPVTFAYARFSLNICLCYQDVDSQIFLQSKVHEQLVAYTSFPSEIIVGPALMALVHLSLLPNMKSLIIEAGILPNLLKVLVKFDSNLILAQGCKLLASLALHFPNKLGIVTSGCFHGVVDLILGTSKRAALNDGIHSVLYHKIQVPRALQYYALAATSNIVHGSDANRSLALELKAVYPMVYALDHAQSSDIIIVASKALANIAYNNPIAGATILSYGGDMALLRAIKSSDIVREPEVASTCLCALSNLCTNEANQSHIGAQEAGLIIEVACRLCEHARDAALVGDAARALLALSWNHTSNKARLATHGAVLALMKRIIHYSNKSLSMAQDHMDLQEIELSCLHCLCSALTSILLNKWTHSKLDHINGIEEVTRLATASMSPRLLSSLGMILCAMVPSPDELCRYRKEAYAVSVERSNSLQILKKIRVLGFSNVASPPSWLNTAVSILSSSDEALAKLEPWDKTEFVAIIPFYKEFVTAVHPDAAVMTDDQLKGFIYSLY